MDIKEELDLLNIIWKNARPEYDYFVFDGILNYDIFQSQSPKILFLLKESNADFNPIAPLPNGFIGYGPRGNSNTFWRYMKGYEFIISSVVNKNNFDLNELHVIKEQPNNSIAYVNIKKQCENNRISNNNDLRSYVTKDREFLNRQIDLINPDVIYCAGTFSFLKLLDNNLIEVSDNVYKSNKRIIIDYKHLAHRDGYGTFMDLHNKLIAAKL